VNVTAPLMLISGFWASMCERGGGLVLNVTSPVSEPQPLDKLTSLAGSDLPTNGPLYGASKAALNRMANAIAQDGLAHGIAVINMNPGHVVTENQGRDLPPTGSRRVRDRRDPPRRAGRGHRLPHDVRKSDALQRPGRRRTRARRGARHPGLVNEVC
jgi:NAD(P)-dependent dehydrogenase (short-subunit alcohol dehydrogenase family)